MSDTSKPLTITRKQANVLYRAFREHAVGFEDQDKYPMERKFFSWLYDNIDKPLDFEIWVEIKKAIDSCFADEWISATKHMFMAMTTINFKKEAND